MSVKLRVVLIAVALLFLATVVSLVRRGRLQLKYSLLWLALALIFLTSALFPQLVSFLSHFFGIALSSNFVFLAALVGLFAISLSLTVIVSWQSRDIRSLIQRIALLEKRLDESTPFAEE